MTQAELINSFELEWIIYIVVFVAIGGFEVLIAIVMLIYHYILNCRVPKRPKIKFLSYFKPLYPPIISGFILSVIPISAFLISNSCLMSGEFWDYKTPLNDCDEYDYATCKVSLFDYFLFQVN